MPNVNETVVEIVRFTEKGIDEISAHTKAMTGEINEAQKKAKILAGLMNDPRYARHAQKIETVNRQYELMALRMRNVAAAQGLADGSTVRHQRSVQRLNEQYARTRREVELVAKYGERAGRFLARHGEKLTAAGNAGALAAGGIAATSFGLARQGFQGTVEQARFDLEMKMLSRELAGIFKPVMEVMTRGGAIYPQTARTARRKRAECGWHGPRPGRRSGERLGHARHGSAGHGIVWPVRGRSGRSGGWPGSTRHAGGRSGRSCGGWCRRAVGDSGGPRRDVPEAWPLAAQPGHRRLPPRSGGPHRGIMGDYDMRGKAGSRQEACRSRWGQQTR